MGWRIFFRVRVNNPSRRAFHEPQQTLLEDSCLEQLGEAEDGFAFLIRVQLSKLAESRPTAFRATCESLRRVEPSASDDERLGCPNPLA